MAIEWDEDVTTTTRVRMIVTEARTAGSCAVLRHATVDDLRRACEAAGLELFTAQHKADCEDARGRLDHACQQHAEDLEKLGREMNEVSRAEATMSRASSRCATILVIACPSDSLSSAPASCDESDRTSVVDAARHASSVGSSPVAARMAASSEVARMREEVAAANAHAEPAYRTVKSIGEILSVEPDYEKVTDKVRTLRARVAELEAERDDALAALEGGANEGLVAAAQRVAVESHDMRVKELRTLEAAPPCGASPWVNQLSKESVEFWDAVNAFAVASGGRADAVNTARMNAVVRINSAVNALLVGTPSDATPAPQGQPVATDEELSDLYVHERSLFLEDPDRTGTEARRLAIRAVARHVRAERPACLVARAVALGCDIQAVRDVRGNVWVVRMFENGSAKGDVAERVHAADVPATLARLLDEVEAARKAVAR